MIHQISWLIALSWKMLLCVKKQEYRTNHLGIWFCNGTRNVFESLSSETTSTLLSQVFVTSSHKYLVIYCDSALPCSKTATAAAIWKFSRFHCESTHACIESTRNRENMSQKIFTVIWIARRSFIWLGHWSNDSTASRIRLKKLIHHYRHYVSNPP